MFLLHITKFQFIEALDGHRLHSWHLNIAKYAQNLVQYKPHVQKFQNLKITLTRSQNRKNLGPTLSICGLLFGPKLLINAWTFGVGILINAETLTPRFANWPPKFDGILFSALGSIQGHKVQHLLVTWGRLKIFFLFQPWLVV
jgi:hypothetical protein